MKSKLMTLCLLALVLAGCAASEEETEVAYCVDRSGRVIEEERCESDRQGLDSGDIMLLYFLTRGGGAQHHYHYGQAVPVQSAFRRPTGSRTVFRASEVVKTPPGAKPLRVTPAPPKPAGWSVKTSPSRTSSTSPAHKSGSSSSRSSSSSSSRSSGGRK